MRATTIRAAASDPRPAGLLRRIGAMVYDTLVLVALWLVTLFPIVAIFDAAVAGIGVQALLLGELVGFFGYFWIYRGQTTGMLAWGLKLETLSGARMTWPQVVRRLAGAALSFACFGLGYLWIIFDPAKRSWSDLLSASVVMHERRSR